MKHIKLFENFDTEEITSGSIKSEGIKKIIQDNNNLYEWFNSYFKTVSGDEDYDFMDDNDFFENGAYEFPENVNGELQVQVDPDDLFAICWASLFNYILEKNPNPNTETALDDAISSITNDVIENVNMSNI